VLTFELLDAYRDVLKEK